MKTVVGASMVLLAFAQAAFAVEGGECPATDASPLTEMAGVVSAAATLPAPTLASLPIAERNPAADVVARFYEAFVKQDFATMEALYDEDLSFKDPIFEYESRAGTMGMWRNLLTGSTGTFSYKVTGVQGDTVNVRWIADYEVFGRPVHNEIDTTMIVRDGKIVNQRDVFSWEKWSRQALPLGHLSSTKPVRWVVTKALRYVASRPPKI